MFDILFVKTSSLGDVVHHFPAVTDAARHRPDARIAWIVEEAFAPLAELHPAVNEVIPVATRRWRQHILQPATWREMSSCIMTLRERDEDVVIDTQGLIRSALIARMVPGVRHGYDAASIREPLAARLYDVKHAIARNLHAVARNRQLTALALGYDVSGEVDYGLLRQAAPARAQPYALLLHGTSKVAKEWRDSEWIGLGQWLRKQGLGVKLPWGNAREQERCARLSAAISGSEVLERQPLDEVAKVIAGAKLVVGVDTGLMHLAAAYRVPLIGVYRATDPALTGPEGTGPIRILGGKDAGKGAGIDDYPGFARVIEAAGELIG